MTSLPRSADPHRQNWRWAKTDPAFPKPVNLTPGCTRWRLSEIIEWEQAKQAA
ncbi:MAG: helix-turn-helix transcriptional regulator [Roseinatronobacter sp.]